MATITASTKATEISTGEGKARFCELVRRAEVNGETIFVTRRGKPVAKIAPIEEQGSKSPKEDWVLRVAGMLDDAPEVFDAIDEIYQSRQHDTPRPVNL